MEKPLKDVTALVVSKPLGPVDTKQALSTKLESLGARVAARLGKEVTHVIFQRQRKADKQEQLAEDAELNSLYDKTLKMDFPVAFVSPLWVESCNSENRRVLERNFVVSQPVPNLFTYSKTPGSGTGLKKPQRRCSVLPRAPERYQVDITDARFSSSQQMAGGITAGDGAEEVASPAPMTSGFARGKKRSANVFGSKEPCSKPVQESSMEDAGLDDYLGTGTQIAAEMLTGLSENVSSCAQQALLAMKRDVSGSKARRLTKGGKANGVSKMPTTAGRGRRPASAVATVTKANCGKASDRSSSAPQLRRQAPARRAQSRLKQGKAAADRRLLSGDGRGSAGKNGGAAEHLRGNVGQTGLTHHTAGHNELGEDANRVCETSALVAGTATLSLSHADNAPQVVEDGFSPEGWPGKPASLAARLALRDVKSRTEMQMPIVRTALQPPQPTPQCYKGQAIPVPKVRRVDSPWADPPPEQAAGTPSTSGPTSNPPPPPVWSQPRPWDPKKTSQQHTARTMQAECSRNETLPDASCGTDGKHDVEMEDAEVGPQQGCLALSSVEPAIQELARSAVKRLRGLRLCPEGAEDRVTHLIVEKERRTLKVLLAVANGAWLLTPAWLTGSLEAGVWLPEAPFQAEVRFAEAAHRARKVLAAEQGQPLLAGQRVYVHSPEQARKGGPNNSSALKRLVAALGAKLAARRDASLCIVTGAEPKRPSGLDARCKAVREEWLLQLTERYSLPIDDAPWAM